MAKAITKFICQQCGYESAGFLGRCPSCGTWGSLVETLLPGEGERARGREGERETKPISLGEVKTAKFQRLSTKIGEFDRVLGGGPPRRDGRVEAGIVPGSVILLAGDPGIGKSTILLQVAANIPGTVLYISGEESPEQIKIRSERLGIKDKNILFLSETNVEAIVDQLEI